MFLKRLTALSRSLAFRLTLWYAGIFALSSCLAFVFFYYLVIDVLREQTDDNLRRQLAAFSGIMQVDGITGVQQVAAMDALSGGDKKRLIRLLSRFGTEFTAGGRDYWQDVGVNAEAIRDLLNDPEILGTFLMSEKRSNEREQGIGVIEAPRGTLFHHYWQDADGLLKKANLIVSPPTTTPP